MTWSIESGVLEYIDRFQSRLGYAPSLTDIMQAHCIQHKTTVARIVNKLCRSGHLKKTLKAGKLFYSVDRRPLDDK